MTVAETVQAGLAQVRARIAHAEARFGRAAGAVQLVAVSKTVAVEGLLEALRAGQRRFGENYVQEALAKMHDARLSGADIEWHYIGALQRNKTAPVAAHFDWVHTVDRLAVAVRLSEQRPAQRTPLNVCVQVNISGESSKTGVSLAQLPELSRAVAALPRLRLRGLMAIPRPGTDFAAQRPPFQALRAAFEQLRAQGLALDTLSMGMSQDLEAAIAEGATLVRVGTAIWGVRS